MIGPTLRLKGRVLLVGCGITGSWVLPVLVRTARAVDVYDPDELDLANPHGLWPVPAELKVHGVSEPRYTVGQFAKKLSSKTDLPDAKYDLAVLCPDNAVTRLFIGRALRVPMLDIRATPKAIVAWAVKGPKTHGAWRESLRGYPRAMPCGHHDNVPLQAGATAAHFVAWWMTSGSEGMWTVPYGFA